MVTGGILLKITAQNIKTGAVRHSKQLAYVSSHVSVPYLSLTACIDLGLVPATFPEVASSDAPETAAVHSMSGSPSQQCSNGGVPSPADKSGTRPCNCPTRQLPPTSEPMLPCAPTQEKLAPPAWISPPTVAAFDCYAEDNSSDVDKLMMGKVLTSFAGINHQSSLAPMSSPEQPSVLSWSRLEANCQTCEEYMLLHKMVQSGGSDKKEDWDSQIVDFFPHRQSLVTVGPVVMLHDRPIIPRPLRQNVLDHLHAGHASATAMFERAATSLYWPNLRADMINYRAMCTTCTR